MSSPGPGRPRGCAAPSTALVGDLVTGGRILHHAEIVDAFGALSVRHDKDPGCYLMADDVAPGLAASRDIVAFKLDGDAPGRTRSGPPPRQRFIHGAIYRARPDVTAIVHCAAPALIAFAATRTGLRPIHHLSGVLGAGAPLFDARAAFGATDLQIATPELGAALARALGERSVVLLRGHGAVMVGVSLRQAVYRAIQTTVNARLQLRALQLGGPEFLSPEEARKTAAANSNSLDRAWNLWAHDAARNSRRFRALPRALQ